MSSVRVVLTAQDLMSPTIASLKQQLDNLGAKATIRVKADDLLGTNTTQIKAGIDIFTQSEELKRQQIAQTREAERKAKQEAKELAKQEAKDAKEQAKAEKLAYDERLASVQAFKNGLASLGASAVQYGLQMVIQGFQALGSSIMSAANIQTQFIANSSDVATNLGVSLTTAKGVNTKLQENIAKIAADLPGETSDYNYIAEQISGTVASVTKGQPQAYQNLTEDITKRTGVLTAVRGISPAFAGRSMNTFIAGTSGFAESMRHDIFQKNPQLRNAIIEEARKLNIDLDNWRELQTSTRLAVVQAALRVATPDSLINEFSGTVESIYQTWKTKLFDPRVGLLGMLRKVKSAGDRTVIDSVQGLFQAIDSLFSSFDLKIDPLVPLIAFIDWLADLTNSFHLFLQSKPSFSLDGLVDGLTNSINYGIAWLRQAWEKIDYQAIGKVVWQVFRDTVIVLGKTLIGINWGDIRYIFIRILRASTDIFIGILRGVLEDLGNFIGNAIRGLLDSIKLPSLPGLPSFSTIPNPLGIIGDSAKAVMDKLSGASQSLPTTPSKPLVVPATSPTNQTVSNNSFQPVVNLTVGQVTNATADDIASLVLDALDKQYQAYSSTQLA